MKIIRKFVVPSVEYEEVIDGITYQELKYSCPTCSREVYWFQSRCDCGQRLKHKFTK